MAVSAESFLALEESLASRLRNSWSRVLAPIARKIDAAVKKEDFTLAYALAKTIDMTPVAERNRKFIELVGMGSILFGTSQLGAPGDSSFAGEPKPEQLEKAVDVMVMVIAENGTAEARETAERAIGDEEDRLKEESQQVEKAEPIPFTKAFVSSVKRSGDAFINIGSSQHTSRLASWGMTTEAEVLGITTFTVSEQLDSRTCPVCRTMHGKSFSVTQAKAKLEDQLSVENTDDLKAIAPWPKQDKASISELQGMSNQQIANKGWDTPPYHPMCRGILVTSVQIVEEAPLRSEFAGTLEFEAADEAQKYFAPRVSSFAATLTEGQTAQVALYQKFGHKQMNRTLRRGTFAEATSGTALTEAQVNSGISSLSKSITKSPALDNDTIVWRGLEKRSTFTGAMKLRVGAIIEDKGFVSVGMAQESVGDFLSGASGAIMKIRLPKGTRALNPTSITGSGASEAELILQKGTKFRVIRAGTMDVNAPRAGGEISIPFFELEVVEDLAKSYGVSLTPVTKATVGFALKYNWSVDDVIVTNNEEAEEET